MIKNNKNYSEIAYKTSTDLQREKIIDTFDVYKYKIKTMPSINNIHLNSYTFTYNEECKDKSILYIKISGILSAVALINVVVNNVLVYKDYIEDIDINIPVYVKKNNVIKISFNNVNGVILTNLLVSFIGNIKYVDNIRRDFIKIKTNEVSNITMNNGNIIYKTALNLANFIENNYQVSTTILCDNFYSLTYNYIANTNTKYQCIMLYKTIGGVYIKNHSLNNGAVIASDADCACIVPLANTASGYQVIYSNNNVVTCLVLNELFDEVSSNTITHYIDQTIVDIVNVDICDGQDVVCCFGILTSANDIYICFSNGGQLNSYSLPYKIAYGTNVNLSISDNKLYCVSKTDSREVTVKTFDIITSGNTKYTTPILKETYYNCDYGFCNNGTTYIANDNQIAEIIV